MITPDGCAVDFYALMPDFGESAIVHEAAGAGASILELGAGAGRVTHPLIALGHLVVAVDESPEMLAHVRDAETVCARIQDLSLGRRFGAVLLASHLINADDETRGAFLAVCRQHVAGDGCVIIQQHSPAWFAGARDGEMTRDGVIYRLRDVSRPAPNLLSATVEYVVGDQCWTQTFTATQLDEAGLTASLAAAGLRLDRYLTEDRSWLRAVPMTTAGFAPFRGPPRASRRSDDRRGLNALSAALAAERAPAYGRAVGAVHLAGVLRALGAGVGVALTVERLAELALDVIDLGLGVLRLGLGSWRRVVGRGSLGSGLLDSHGTSWA